MILISVDTLRADHLSCYGYTRLRTPHIDSLAQDGTRFAEISAQAPITLPSHVSLFTSTYPFANGIRENAQVLPPGATTLATVLAAHMYRTAAFIGGYFLDARYGLAQGFETYDSPFAAHPLKGALDLKRPAPKVLAAAERWLQQNGDRPFFLFVHLFDLHQPYDAPATYRTRAPASEYDQELAYVDDSLGQFLDFLAQRGLDRRALIVLFSDHGESLGDHGETTHGYFVYRSTLHVPLIFHWPARGESTVAPADSERISKGCPTRVEAPAGLIDVAPTLLNFLGFPAPPTFCGHSLLGAAEGNLPPREVYSESSYAHDKFGWASLRSLIVGDYQSIEAPHAELYNVKTDPAESHNLVAEQSALAGSYRERLKALVQRYASAQNTPAATPEPGARENLQSLGYLEITGPHSVLDDSGVDPKDRLFEYKRYLMAGHLARTGKTDEAAAELESIIADDPRNLPARIELARLEVGLRRYVEAANQLRAALRLDPQSVEAEELMGNAALAMGDDGRAAAEFHQLLTFASQDYVAHLGLGLIAARRGESAEAVRHFRDAIAADPVSAEAHYRLGMVLANEGQTPAAVAEFQAALQIDPQLQAARRELRKLRP